MDFPGLQAELRRLGETVHALAAIGAALRLRQAREAGHPAVQPRLDAVVDALIPGTLDSLDEQQVSTALATITFHFEDGMELLRNPARAPAWTIQDPAMLQAQGQASRANVRSILSLAADRPKLAAAVSQKIENLLRTNLSVAGR